MKLKTLTKCRISVVNESLARVQKFQNFSSPFFFEKRVKMRVIRYQHEYATHIWEFRKHYPVVVCFRVKPLFQLGLLEVVMFPGSRFFRNKKNVFQGSSYLVPTPFMIFSCPKFSWLITSIHLSKGFIMVEWSRQILQHDCHLTFAAFVFWYYCSSSFDENFIG